VERWFPIGERGKANGIIFGGVGVGSGVTPPIVTAIIFYYGWRASFWFSAVVGIFAGACWYWMARNTPEEHPRISSVELSWIQQRRAMEGTADTLSHGPNKRPVPWTKIFTSTEMIALTLSYFSFGYVAWVFFGWFYIYLAQARGLNLRSSALYSMLPFVGMTIGCLMGGVLSDWVARRLSIRLGRCLIPAVSMAVTAALLILGSRAHEARTAGVVLACGAGALYVSQSCFFAVTADFAGEFAGVASGIMNMGAQVGGACTSSLTPLIAAHFGWEQSFVIAASLSVLGAIAWLTVDPKNSLSISELAS
jgi:MFS transporter, ACS family, glucarate transporter